MKRKISLLAVFCLLLTTVFSCLVGADGIYQPTERVVYYEDYSTNSSLKKLTKNNDTTHTSDGKTPINNMYDQKIVGTGYTDFAGSSKSQFKKTDKEHSLQGNHASDYSAEQRINVFSMSNQNNPNAGKGLLTVVPKSAMANLDQFTVSYIQRQYKPAGGYFGLALFYNDVETVDGIDYFGDYDNFTFTGLTGNMLNTYEAYTVANGIKTNFDVAALTTTHTKENQALYMSVTCTNGLYKINGVDYTAKIESYVDDYLISTSYAQWVDAPVMLYYETPDTRWDVQFTNIKVTTKTAHIDTAGEAGTGVAYKGCQEQINNDKFNVRFVATVDSLEYSAVGFEIAAKYTAGEVTQKTYGKDLSSVYSGILAEDGKETVLVNAEALGGKYIMAYSINNIPLSVGTATFTVRPYYQTEDGQVFGAAYTVIYQNGVFVSQTVNQD